MVGVKKRKVVVLTEGTPWKCILEFAIPLFLGSLLQQLYYTIDTMMVGKFVGEQALSGVGTCTVLTNLLVSFSVGFSAGAGIISAKHFGADNKKEITKNAYATMLSLLAIGILIGGLSIAFCNPMLRYIVAVPESLLDYSGEYFRICALGFLFQFLYNGIAALLRSLGDSKASLYFLLLSSVINILLDYVFMKWMFMGVFGAALATVIAQGFSCVISFIYMYRHYEVLRFLGKRIRIAWSDISLISSLGFPMALQSMVGTVFNLMIQRLVNSFGEAMIASYTVVSRVEGYMHLPTTALYQSIPTYTAQNIGANHKERIRIGLRHTVIMAMISTLFISIVTFFGTPMIVNSFSISGLSAQYCVANIRWLSFPILLFAIYFPCTGLYQGMGKGMIATASSVAFLTVCLILAYTLQYIPAIGYQSIFISKPISWVIIATLNYIYYFSGKWKKGTILQTKI